MLKHLLAASSVAAVALVLSTGMSAANADTQPANLGNVENVDRGASAPGPHCHFVLPARDAGPFDDIITGAAHQGHTETGTPTGIFQATTCP
jgi:hypothetical protein